MELTELRTMLDFGMVVILWLVQLVIYPSFLRCELTRLVEWHRVYTRRAAWVIIPIMFTQLPLVGWLSWQEPTKANLTASACLLVCWVLTFGVSVPLHHKIDSGDTSGETIQRLIKTNWPRTFLWTVAFFFGLQRGVS
jgi:hypothetical protein